MTTNRHSLVHQIIAEFAPRHIRRPRVLIPGRKLDRKELTSLGVSQSAVVAMPDLVIHDLERDWLFLIDASTRKKQMTEARRVALETHFEQSGRHLILFSAFPSPRDFCRSVESIGWDTHVWIATAPDHIIHFSSQPNLAACVRAA
jgi:type II restriction enzyme